LNVIIFNLKHPTPFEDEMAIVPATRGKTIKNLILKMYKNILNFLLYSPQVLLPVSYLSDPRKAFHLWIV